jgi:hypothetical protein
MPSTPSPPSKKGLSLLTESPIASTSCKKDGEISPTKVGVDEKQKDAYEALLEQTAEWKSQMEVSRDDLLLLQIKNAIILDELAMAGADV